MLHYSVDNELMSDLYRDYRQMKGAEYAQLHELGEHYLSLIEGYDLEESTIKTLQGLVQFETEEELESVENGIVHGYLTAKAALRKEQAEYKEFVRMFDGEEQQALNGLSEYVVGQKKIPYKIKNRILHVDVLSTPAMSLELDFADADVIFSDNYFFLTGEEYEVKMQKSEIRKGFFADAEDVQSRLKVRTLADTYER